MLLSAFVVSLTYTPVPLRSNAGYFSLSGKQTWCRALRNPAPFKDLKIIFMKTIFTVIVLLVLIQAVNAQSANAPVIKITGTKFPFDIMQQWINAYTQIHPEVKFELSKAIPLDSTDLQIAAHAFKPGELKENAAIVAVNRYAQLPIVNSNRPDTKALQAKGFTQQDLKNIFFSAETNKTDPLNNPVTIYKRDKNVCATRSFSENVTGIQKDIYGIAVTGDDRSLSAAVKNDLTGISYNNLGLVYNIHTRKVADSIAVIPIDLNENGKIDNDEKIYSSLDELLNFLGITGNAKIPQENVNIVFNKNTISKPAIDFLNWIITAGQQYNRQFGFLSLGKNVVLQQQHLLSAYISNAKNTTR